MFLVIKGRLLMQFRDHEEWVEEGEFIVVPHGECGERVDGRGRRADMISFRTATGRVARDLPDKSWNHEE